MRSIERYLLGWLLGALSLGLVVIALVTYLVTLEEMNEVFDAGLKNVAMAVSSVQIAGREQGVAPVAVATPAPAPVAVDDEDIMTLAWTPQGQRVHASDPQVLLPFTRVEGLSRPIVDGEAWIVYTLVGEAGVVQAAQRASSRRELASESVTTVLLPMLLLVVLVGVLLVFALRRGLQPLDDTANEVAQRSEKSLEAIATTDVPHEILPLVASVNALMRRLAMAMGLQSRFLADAAHELRTPATALRLQLQLLERAPDEAARLQAMAALKAGVNRTQRLIEQLLAVARSGADGEPMRREPVALDALARSVVASMSAKAEHRSIDLGAQTSGPLVVQGDLQQLTVLLNNLVENALRYTPSGGVVDVHALLQDQHPVLRVTDNGPGIAAHDRRRVFDRFYRGERAVGGALADEGSGLGLAIVQAVAQSHGASVQLGDAAPAGGLSVTVVFARPQAHSAQ